MKPVINHMIQLQELYEARAQQEAAAASHLAELDAAIKTMLAELPADLRARFVRLQKKAHLAIAPVADGVCSACGMKLPVSLVHAVRAAEQIITCPNCARILYALPESSPRSLGRRKRRTEQIKVGIARFSAPELMIPHLESDTRDDVVRELCGKVEAEGFVEGGEQLAERAIQREMIISTAVDHGLAFPHVRGVEGGGLVLTLGIRRKGFHFGPGRNLTRIVFFIVIPTAASAFYLRLLSGLTRSFRQKTARDKLLACDTPEKLWKALLAATRTTIP